MRGFTIGAVVIAGAIALTGCSGQVGDVVRESASAKVSETAAALKDAACEKITAGIEEISSGIADRLETATTETRADVEAYLADAADQVDALLADAENEKLAAAVQDFADEVAASAEYAAGLPDDPSTQDPEKLAELEQQLDDAVAKVEDACSADQ